MDLSLCCRDGFIEAIGFDSDIAKTYDRTSFDTVIDASGKCVIPGERTVQLSHWRRTMSKRVNLNKTGNGLQIRSSAVEWEGAY